MTTQSPPQVLTIPASSPIFSYTPYISLSNNSTDGGDSAAGWTGIAHETGQLLTTFGESADGNWIMVNNISSQTFTPRFSLPSTDAYEVTAQVDSDALVSVSSGDKLSATTTASTHQVRLRVACKLGNKGCSAGGRASAFTFQGMNFEISSLSAPQAAVNATIDDSSKLITYQGFATAGSSMGNTIVNDAIVASSQGKTLSFTATKSATAIVYFTGKFTFTKPIRDLRGSSLQISGVVGPTLGTYSVSVDSKGASVANASRSTFSGQQLMFLAGGLSQGEHQLTITNLDEGKGLALDAFSVWGAGVVCFGQGCGAGSTPPPTSESTSQQPPPPTSTLPPVPNLPSAQNGVPGGRTTGGSNVGSIVGAIFGVLLAIIVLFVIWRCWRKKHPKKEEKAKINAWDEANMLTKQPNHFVRVTPKEDMPYRDPMGTAKTHGRGPEGVSV